MIAYIDDFWLMMILTIASIPLLLLIKKVRPASRRPCGVGMKRAAFPLLSALLVSACTVGPDFKAPQPPAISSYAAKGDAPAPDDQRVALGKQIAGDWWAGFQSPSLNDVDRHWRLPATRMWKPPRSAWPRPRKR